MKLKISGDSFDSHRQAACGPEMTLCLDLCFLWEKHKDSYGKSERLNECIFDEVNMVAIS